MPTYVREKQGREELFEVLLDERRLYVVEGSRKTGERKWSIKQNFPRCYICDTAEAASALHEQKLSKLPKAYKLVAEKAPECEAYRKESSGERDKLLAAQQAWEAEHHLLERLEADGKVYWTGKKDSNAGEYWELVLEGTTLIERRGTIGKGRPKTEKETCRDRESALRSALIKMMCAMNILKFGP